MLTAKRMAELVDRFLCSPLKKQLVVWWVAVEGGVQTAGRYERNIARVLGFTEHEIRRVMEQVDVREGEHLIIPKHTAPDVLKENVRVVLFSKGIVCGWRHLDGFAYPAIVSEQRVGFDEARRQIA